MEPPQGPENVMFQDDGGKGEKTVTTEHNNTSLDAKVEEAWAPSKQVKLVTLSLCFIVFIISLDMTIFTVTLPNVASALDADSAQSFWIVSSYLLANAVVQPLIAALADVFGRQIVFFGGVSAFTIGSIVCSVTHNIAGMLAGRAIQGVGGGTIIAVNLIVLSDIIPLRHRSAYMGIMQLVFGLGLSIAPLVGAGLVKVSWRWLFWINLPFCGIGLVLVPLALRYERPESTFRTKLSMIDWIGSLMCLISISIFLVGLGWGGVQYKWVSAATLVPICLGAIGFIATILYERYLAKYPFLRLSLFKSWSAVAAYVCTVLQSIILFAVGYFVCLYLLAVKVYSPLIAATASLALNLTVIPISGVTGTLITKLGHYRLFITAGWILQTLSLGILILLDVNTSPAAWVWIFLITGASQGVLLIAHNVAIQAASDNRDAAHAGSMYSFCRSLGLCIGVIVGGAIFQNFFRQRLGDLGLDVSIAANAEGFVPILARMPRDAANTLALRHAYAWALQRLWAVLCGLSGIAFLVSLAIGTHTLDRVLESAHVLRSTKAEKGTAVDGSHSIGV